MMLRCVEDLTEYCTASRVWRIAQTTHVRCVRAGLKFGSSPILQEKASAFALARFGSTMSGLFQHGRVETIFP